VGSYYGTPCYFLGLGSCCQVAPWLGLFSGVRQLGRWAFAVQGGPDGRLLAHIGAAQGCKKLSPSGQPACSEVREGQI
jgi:hypothetical protein